MTEAPPTYPRLRIAGDCGLLVEYGDEIDPDVNRKVRSMTLLMKSEPPAGIIETVPSYRSILVRYDPSITTPDRLLAAVAGLEERSAQIEIPPPRVIEIPVCYGGELGPDIEHVAAVNGLSVAEVVERHARPEYLIYMVGFTPGFPFLGGLDTELHTPRLETPRKLVPAGSVGIANGQTGVYPIASPGGWQLIGRTPLRLFAPERDKPFLYRAGDRIRFVPIQRTEYDRLLAREV